MRLRPPPPFVLASSSPRRLALLRQIGLEPDEVLAPDVDESALPDESVRRQVERLARAKAEAGRAQRPDAFVIAGDTLVALGRRVLAKPADAEEARGMLSLLSGRSHRVMTGVAAASPDGRISSRVSETRLKFKRLSPRDLDRFIASGEWEGASGAYKIHGLAGGFVTALSGSYTGVVGLPLYETRCLLEGLGFPSG